MNTRLVVFSSAALLAVAFSTARLSAQAPTYSVTVLGSLGGADGSGANAINDSGQVVGWSYTSGGVSHQSAVIWNSTSPKALLPEPGASSSAADGINDSGQIVGSSGGQAVQWSGLVPTLLGNGDYSSSGALAINTAGDAVGFVNGTDLIQSAVEWTSTGSFGFGTLGPVTDSANAVNNSGQAVGYSVNGDTGHFDAVIWNGTTPTALGSLGGNYSVANGLNDSGQAVGLSLVSGVGDAVEWSGFSPSILTLGGTGGDAFGINDSGQVVGWADTASGAHDAFLLSSGTMYDLNTIASPEAGLDITDATAINSSGQITADGTFDGTAVALLLTPQTFGPQGGGGGPTPEPSPAILAAAGLALIPILRRMRLLK